MRLTLLGMPTSGKSTFGGWIAVDLCVPHIVVGDLLRARADLADDVGRRIAGCLRAGQFAPDAIVESVLAERFRQARDGFVLDGFPRLVQQVQSLDAMLDAAGAELDAAVYLHLSEREARRRLSTRLVCRCCGRSARGVTESEGGACPATGCAGRLAVRQDDRDPVAVGQRLAGFRDFTMPVVRDYAASGRLVHLDVDGESEAAAYPRLRSAIAASLP